MNRKRFSSDEIADIVMKLTGEVAPVGSSEVDSKRFDNIVLLMNVVDILIDEIQLQVPCQNSYEASVKKIGLEAVKWVMEKQEYFDNYFDD